jgi:hypothetical protein
MDYIASVVMENAKYWQRNLRQIRVPSTDDICTSGELNPSCRDGSRVL